MCQSLSTAFIRSDYKVMDDTVDSSVADQLDIIAWFRPELPQCTNTYSS